MPDFRMYDYVSTPNGKGTIQWANKDGSFQVWHLKKDFHGTLPPKFTDRSPTIAMNYKPEEMDYA